MGMGLERDRLAAGLVLGMRGATGRPCECKTDGAAKAGPSAPGPTLNDPDEAENMVVEGVLEPLWGFCGRGMCIAGSGGAVGGEATSNGERGAVHRTASSDFA